MVETALGLLVVMACVLGIIECCMMSYTYGVYLDAAHQGVRYATMHGSDSSSCSGPSTGCGDSTGTNVANQVTTYAAHFVSPASAPSVVVSYPDGSSTPSSRVNVTVTYSYTPLFHSSGVAAAFHASSQGVIVY